MVLISEISCLNLSILRKGNYVVDGEKNEGIYQQAHSHPEIIIRSDCRTDIKQVNLKYFSYKRMEYDIELVNVKSNLGSSRGSYLMFICPITGKKARKLYYCNETGYFKHQTAFHSRLYYSFQRLSKIEKLFETSSRNQRKLLEAFLQLKKFSYKGKPTRTNKRIQSLVNKKMLLDKLIIDWSNRYSKEF